MKNKTLKIEAIRDLGLPKPLDTAVFNLYEFASQNDSEENHPIPDDAELIAHVSRAVCTYLTKKLNPPTKKNEIDF